MSLMIDSDRSAEWRLRAEIFASTGVMFGPQDPPRPDGALNKKLKNNSVSGVHAPGMGRFYSQGTIDSGDNLYHVPSGLVVDNDNNSW